MSGETGRDRALVRLSGHARAWRAELDLVEDGSIRRRLAAPLAPIGWLRRAIRLEPAGVWKRLTRRFRAWIEPLIPTPAHARALVELDAALSGASRYSPSSASARARGGSSGS